MRAGQLTDEAEVDDVSPLRAVRESRGWSQGQVLQHAHVSGGLLSTVESGLRRAPLKLLTVYILRGAPETLAAEQEDWRRARGLTGRPRGQFFFTRSLPDGVRREEARDACFAAIDRLAGGMPR